MVTHAELRLIELFGEHWNMIHSNAPTIIFDYSTTHSSIELTSNMPMLMTNNIIKSLRHTRIISCRYPSKFLKPDRCETMKTQLQPNSQDTDYIAIYPSVSAQ